MATDLRLNESLPLLTQRVLATYEQCGGIHHLGHLPLPSDREVVDILADLRELLYPGFGRRQNLHLGNVVYHVGDLIDSLHDRLPQQVARALRHDCKAPDQETDFEAEAQQIAVRLLESVPELSKTLAEDVQAVYAATRPPRSATRSSSATPEWRPSPSSGSRTCCTSWACR